MSIITSAQLTAELPTGADATKASNAVLRASDLLNTWAVKYEQFPDSTETIAAPYQVQLICIEIAKALYWLGMGQVYRDGQEQDSWQAILNRYEKTLGEINIQPTVYTKAISLDSNGVMLIGRAMHILTQHPSCKVVSGSALSTAMWNQGYHWDIRKGLDTEDELLDGWYFDAETYETTIEGTLYYARSWRNDGLDYQRFRRGNGGSTHTRVW